MRRDTLLLLLLAGGAATLFLDVKYEHRFVLGEDWKAYIPLVASGAAIVATFLAFAQAQAARTFAWVLFALVFATGLAGVYFHTGLKPVMFTRYLKEPAQSAQNVSGFDRPTIAPLSYTGLGLFGMILAWPGKKGRK